MVYSKTVENIAVPKSTPRLRFGINLNSVNILFYNIRQLKKTN